MAGLRRRSPPLAILAGNANWDMMWFSSREARMPTRNVDLTEEQDAFVEEVVRAGKYQDASDAMRDAVRGLQHRIAADQLKLDLLRVQVEAGGDAISGGLFMDLDDADLDAALDELIDIPR